MRASIAILALTLVGISAPRVEARLLPAPVKKAIAPLKKAIGKQTLRFAARTNAKLDRVELQLRDAHPAVADAIARTRRAAKPLSPVRIAGFAAKRVKDNPMLVPAYLSATVGFDAAKLAAVASLPPSIGGPVYVLAAIPQSVISLVTAEHTTRSFSAAKGQRPTVKETLRDLAHEYGKYNVAEDRRVAHAIHLLGVE